MKQITEESKLIGKTIKRYYNEADNQFFLIFEDNTFCIFSGYGYHEWEVELDKEEYSLVPDEYNCRELENLDFITRKECQDVLAKHDRWVKTKQKQNDLEQLKELKAKYPNE